MTESPAYFSGRVARWGLLGSALLLGLIVLATAAVNYRGALDLSATVARGQGEALLQAVRRSNRGAQPQTLAQDLSDLLDEQRELGLTYVAIVDRRGMTTVSAGELLSTPPHARRLREPLIELGKERVIMVAPGSPPGAPPPRPRLRGPEQPSFDPPPDGPAPGDPRPGGKTQRRRRPSGGANMILIEFEPLLSNQLRARALNSLLAGVIGSLGLMLAVGIFWRLSMRADRVDRDMVEQRHLATLGEMSAVLAHEIRNPLAALKGHAQLLEEQLIDDQRARKKAGRVVSEAQRLEQLINSLLDFVRSGKVQKEQVDPGLLLQEAARSIDPDRFKLSLSESPRQWPLDPVRMRRLLVNLLENALQASPEHSLVDVELRVQGDTLLIAIHDRGKGIAEGESERIFEPFHTTRVRGVGLGLAVARRIAEGHGGSIKALNHQSGGAVFEVRVPAT